MTEAQVRKKFITYLEGRLKELEQVGHADTCRHPGVLHNPRLGPGPALRPRERELQRVAVIESLLERVRELSDDESIEQALLRPSRRPIRGSGAGSRYASRPDYMQQKQAERRALSAALRQSHLDMLRHIIKTS